MPSIRLVYALDAPARVEFVVTGWNMFNIRPAGLLARSTVRPNVDPQLCLNLSLHHPANFLTLSIVLSGLSIEPCCKARTVPGIRPASGFICRRLIVTPVGDGWVPQGLAEAFLCRLAGFALI